MAFDPDVVVTKTTIASLRQNVDPTTTIYVNGYATAGDGGQGVFLLTTDTTSSDNGGTIIVDAAGNRYYRDIGGLPYSVKWFGATGNGTTDDTVSINNTCSAANAGGALNSVFVPLGTYLISSSIIPNPNSVNGNCPSFYGENTQGVAFVMKAGFATGTAMIKIQGASPSSVGTKIGGFQLNGLTAAAASGYIGIQHINGCTYRYDGIDFQNLYAGIQWQVLGAGFAEQNLVSNCEFNTVYYWEYYLSTTGALSSFRDTGLGPGCQGVLAVVNGAQGSCAYISGTGGVPKVYDAPFNVTVWDCGYPAVLVVNACSTSAAVTGTVTTEFGTNGAVFGSGSNGGNFAGILLSSGFVTQAGSFNVSYSTGNGFYAGTGASGFGGGAFGANYPPAISPSLDASASAVTVASGASAGLCGFFSGLYIISDSVNADTAVYVVGGNTAVLIATTVGSFVASTTTPASGKSSIAYSGGLYNVYNNTGGQVTYSVASIRSRFGA